MREPDQDTKSVGGASAVNGAARPRRKRRRRNMEKKIRIVRENALFAGHDEGAKAWVRIVSLAETAKINQINPHAYLKATLEAIAAGHPASDIDALMPRAYAPASS